MRLMFKPYNMNGTQADNQQVGVSNLRSQIEDIVNCGTCYHRKHSGSFTLGGAKSICDHPDCSVTVKKMYNLKDEDANRNDKNYKIEDQCYYWRNRLVESFFLLGKIPKFCPLKNGFKY